MKIKPSTKYKTIHKSTIVPEGTIVTSPSAANMEAAKGSVNPESIMMSIKPGCALHFTPAQLEEL